MGERPRVGASNTTGSRSGQVEDASSFCFNLFLAPTVRAVTMIQLTELESPCRLAVAAVLQIRKNERST